MEDAIAKVAVNTDEAEDVLQMVGFVVAEELFGVDILTVQEIIKDVTITAIPDAPDFIQGVVNLRGNIIPVIDLRKRLKLAEKKPGYEEEFWIIILNIGGRVTGFIVDRVTKVIKVQTNHIKPPPEMVVSGLQSDYIRGVCKQDQQLLAILDFNRILLVDEFKKLSVLKKQKNR
ncbi:MAG: chemotaxis protein CheW [Desulfobacteraceae bacterium]|jgi:purine-binding chemotaxis protein CheW